MKDKLQTINEMLRVQGADGNWNYDPYMQGLYNGMEMIVSILEDRDPIFRDAPEVWLKDIPFTGVLTCESETK